MYAQTPNSQTQDGNIAISRFMSGTRTAFENAAGQVRVAAVEHSGSGQQRRRYAGLC